jgi:[protein-PII] uridylyltransferase
LHTQFSTGADIKDLVNGRSWLVDQLLRQCWQRILGGNSHAALIAVGGYGRHELLPGSDVDLMILLDQTESPALAEKLKTFLNMLWDTGLEVGHSVRTLADCVEQSQADITVATTLMEARLLAGSEQLLNTMHEQTGPAHLWTSHEFFEAKRDEQMQRHLRFDDAVYNLEPNVKEGPGGLRDVQTIGWVVKRHFNSDTLAELVVHGFLDESEYRVLIDGQQFLWQVRFGLHMLAGRREDRLLFDYQRNLAELLSYQDKDHRLAVELFMKDYYRTIQEISRLNQMLLQLFEEDILFANDPVEPRVINRRFQSKRDVLETTDEHIFEQYTFALLEMFLLLQQHRELKGVSAATVRQVRNNLHRIDDYFRNDIRNRSLFMEIFRQGDGLTHVLRQMNLYGVLAAYYPAFEKIVGQMQYDLFHVYTVDEHTLFVVRNLRRFTVPECSDEFPLCSRISASIAKPELLYLAGFFHDIAKGRGGDHSELGAVEAKEFLSQHDMSRYDQELVAWLVGNHLIMSQTAQRRDINDPEVINDFAAKVGDRQRLDHLYLLTVADIRATSPTLWNAWKDALLKELYTSTKRALRRGLENPLNRDELITDFKVSVLNQLVDNGVDAELIESLWIRLPDDYYLRHSFDEVIWHSEVILAAEDNSPQIKISPLSERGGSALFIYTPVIDGLFSRTNAILEKLGLNITDARIFTTMDGFAVNTYHVLNTDGEPLEDNLQIQEIIDQVKQILADENWSPNTVDRRHNRRTRHFEVNTRVTFIQDDINHRTILELITTDRTGLLSCVAKAFYKCDAIMQNAKIATFGSQAEDVFYLMDKQGQPLQEQTQECLRAELTDLLDNNQ